MRLLTQFAAFVIFPLSVCGEEAENGAGRQGEVRGGPGRQRLQLGGPALYGGRYGRYYDLGQLAFPQYNRPQ